MCRVNCTFRCLSVFLDLRFLLTFTSAFLQFPLTASPSASCYILHPGGLWALTLQLLHSICRCSCLVLCLLACLFMETEYYSGSPRSSQTHASPALAPWSQGYRCAPVCLTLSLCFLLTSSSCYYTESLLFHSPYSTLLFVFYSTALITSSVLRVAECTVCLSSGG